MDSRFRKACKWSSPLLQLLNKLLPPPPPTITKRKRIIPTRENKPREVEEEEAVEVEVDAKSKKNKRHSSLLLHVCSTIPWALFSCCCCCILANYHDYLDSTYPQLAFNQEYLMLEIAMRKAWDWLILKRFLFYLLKKNIPFRMLCRHPPSV
jgi:hypothetical protein